MSAKEIPTECLRSKFQVKYSRESYRSEMGSNISLKNLEQFVKNDRAAKKTLARRLVENILQKYRWYNPHKGKAGAPSVELAWAYYEHITLPRRIIGEGDGFVRAMPGEMKKTELYSFRYTPSSAFNHWGSGVVLYFKTLQYLGLIFLLLGVVNMYNCYYYYDIYNGGNTLSDFKSLAFNIPFLITSGVCTNVEWYPCSDCDAKQWLKPTAQLKYATSMTSVDSFSEIVFVERNLCEVDFLRQGFVNYASLIIIFVFYVVLIRYQDWEEKEWDEKMQTSTDYSIEVTNPPRDAYDPEVWKEFFSQFTCDGRPITLCTIVLDNSELLEALISRRKYMNALMYMIHDEIEIDISDPLKRRQNVDNIFLRNSRKKFWKWPLTLFGLCLDEHELLDKIEQKEKEIIKLQRQQYNVKKVFVTFETEVCQRNALTALDTSQININHNRTKYVPPSTVFCGRILSIKEPAEPHAVRFLDISSPNYYEAMTKKILLSHGLYAIFLVFDVVIVIIMTLKGPLIGGATVSFMNCLLFEVCLMLNKIEMFSNEGDKEKALSFKTVLLRWINYGFIIPFITPFVQFLGIEYYSLLPRISSIYISHLFVLPLYRLSNLLPNFRMHYLAPRAKTQDGMNMYFGGYPYYLADRYTEFTTIILLCLMFSSIFPFAFFLVSINLFVTYFTDKFCLLKIWCNNAPLGFEVCAFNRDYFLKLTVLAIAIFSAFIWSSFPFDNVCEDNNFNNNQTLPAGLYSAVLGNQDAINITLNENVPWVRYCSQQSKHFLVPTFTNVNWMSPDQEFITLIYGWTSAAILILYIIVSFGTGLYTKFIRLFRGIYKRPAGRPIPISFSDNDYIHGYIPQIREDGFSFPLLTCDIDDISKKFIGWNDRFHSYDFHNLIYDVPYQGMKRSRRVKSNDSIDYSLKHQPEPNRLITPIFSYVKHWANSTEEPTTTNDIVPQNSFDFENADVYIRNDNDEELDYNDNDPNEHVFIPENSLAFINNDFKNEKSLDLNKFHEISLDLDEFK